MAMDDLFESQREPLGKMRIGSVT